MVVVNPLRPVPVRLYPPKTGVPKAPPLEAICGTVACAAGPRAALKGVAGIIGATIDWNTKPFNRPAPYCA